MKEEDKVMVCILLETYTFNWATGITGFSLFPLLKILHKLDHHLLPFLMPKSLKQSSPSNNSSHWDPLKTLLYSLKAKQLCENDLFIQEARRIAEKAVAVADTDERVNRAVTAANRAANAA
ncbi:hypothetical protein Tco_0783016, partial [Tanacetum coccineum]